MNSDSPSDSDQDLPDALEDEEVVVDEDQDDDVKDDDDQGNLAKRAKDNQRALRTVMRENAELRKAVDDLRVTRDQRPAQDWLDQVDQDEVITDGSKLMEVIRNLRSDVLDQTAGVLRHKFAEQDSKLVQSNPDVIRYREVIEELRDDEDFTDWTDEQLLPVAKRIASKKHKRAPASPPGGRRSSSAPKEKDIKESPLYKMMYGDLEEKKDA